MELKKYKLSKSLLNYLQGTKIRLNLGQKSHIKYIDFFSLVDTVEMKIGRQKVLRISKKVENYEDIIIIWNPKLKLISYYDLEHEEFGNIASFEEFRNNPDEYMEKVINGELL